MRSRPREVEDPDEFRANRPPQVTTAREFGAGDDKSIVPSCAQAVHLVIPIPHGTPRLMAARHTLKRVKAKAQVKFSAAILQELANCLSVAARAASGMLLTRPTRSADLGRGSPRGEGNACAGREMSAAQKQGAQRDRHCSSLSSIMRLSVRHREPAEDRRRSLSWAASVERPSRLEAYSGLGMPRANRRRRGASVGRWSSTARPAVQFPLFWVGSGRGPSPIPRHWRSHERDRCHDAGLISGNTMKSRLTNRFMPASNSGGSSPNVRFVVNPFPSMAASAPALRVIANLRHGDFVYRIKSPNCAGNSSSCH